jgi:hypothetical protein
MIIADLPEKTILDNTYYLPLDIGGDVKKISADKVLPHIANDLTTTDIQYSLDASQGKVLNDLILANTATLDTMQASVDAGVIFRAQPWTLYRRRTVNNVYIAYPSNANEVMICAWENADLTVFTSLFIPGEQTASFNLLLGGYYQLISSKRYNAYVYIPVDPTNHRVSNIKGSINFGTTGYDADITTSSDWTTEVWYR